MRFASVRARPLPPSRRVIVQIAWICPGCHNRFMSRRRDQRGDVAPLLVFAILLLVVAVVAAGIVLTRGGGEGADPAAAPTPTAPPTDHQLTDTEAIALFDRLDRDRRRALEERRLDLVDLVFTPNSPAAARLKRTIAILKRDAAFADERVQVIDRRVLSARADQIRIQQVALLDVKFADAEGRDITKKGGLERQKVNWTMRLYQDNWRLHEGVVIAARPVNG